MLFSLYIPTHLLPDSSRSVLQASDMPEKKRKLLLNVFKKFKQKFIWKWETEQMEGLPSNVKLSKWLPQQDILAHPNTKMFITHGGQTRQDSTSSLSQSWNSMKFEQLQPHVAVSSPLPIHFVGGENYQPSELFQFSMH